MAWRLRLLWLALLLLSACAGQRNTGKYYQDDGPPSHEPRHQTIADAIPKPEPKSKQGNPKSYVVFGKRYHVLDSAQGYVEKGIASWYGKKFHGRKTSNGETYDMHAMTAAHKTLPIPTYVEVKNLKTGQTVIVRVNDRGPFRAGRIIDLSYSAAKKLNIMHQGTGLVEVRAINPGQTTNKPASVLTQALSPTQIYLQLGAFNIRSNAQQLKNQLSQSLPNILISPGPDALYRVRLGPFNTIDQVDKAITRLIDYGHQQFHVVIE